MRRSPLGLHLPDADQFTNSEIAAVYDLLPSILLTITYSQWDDDKGAAASVRQMVRDLGHADLYVRFHADPNPVAYARKIGGARKWGQLCARRMTQYYGFLSGSGVQLHAILCNEVDADYEGGLDEKAASNFLSDAFEGYKSVRGGDTLHVPATTGAPDTHWRYLNRIDKDGWLEEHPEAWIDGHGYNGDLENVINTLQDIYPNRPRVITETNNLDDFSWPIELLRQGRARDIIYFTLNWAAGGEGRVKPPNPDDAAKHMSLMRFPDRYAQFKATTGAVEIPPETPPQPQEPPTMPETQDFPLPVDDNGQEWRASTSDVLAAIRDVAPRIIDPKNPARAIKLLTALGIAESGIDFQAQERWHIWTDHGIEAVRQRNLGYAAQVLGWGRDVGTIGTNDFSAGPFHQAWAWWDQFPGNPLDKNDPHRWDVMGWLDFRKRFIQDHGYATEYAAKRLKTYYDRNPNDLQWVLERYNKPNEEVSPGVRANYARALGLADTLNPAEIPDGNGQGGVPIPVPSGSTVFEDYTDHAPAGTFASTPGGVILHGSRSGKASNPLDAEYAGTANYEVNNPGGLGWNATIGVNKAARHLDARHWGWNARAASDNYLAVEFAQPTNANAIPDGEVDAFADWFVSDVLTVWPDIPLHFPTHAEVENWGETGVRDGKDDVFPFQDIRADQLRARIMAAIEARRSPAQTDPGVPAPPVVPDEPNESAESDAHKVERMVSAIGYIGGDLHDRLVKVAGLADAPKDPDRMKKAEAVAALKSLWEDAELASEEVLSVAAEIKRVRDEQLR